MKATEIKQNVLDDPIAFKKANSRLLKKIERDFDKKFFIGDIVITDLEYEILCEYLANKCKGIIQSKSALKDCPEFAVALVQIGIRKYKSKKFWPYLNEAIGFKIQPQDQILIGTSFINTLKAHNKHVQSESERVSSILFHTFVSNYYSRGLFELLFQYYKNDLERDINRNDSEQMKALMETFAVKSLLSEEDGESFTDQFMDKGSRAYKLRQHTLQAISSNQSHSTARLRRFIRLIDKAFWKDSVPKNPTSRLTILFKEWVSESESFKHEYRQYQMGAIRNRGKKHFATPYLFAKIAESTFSLKLPAQIVREEFSEGLQWRVSTTFNTQVYSSDTYPVLTGFKTEELEIDLNNEEIFGAISCELICDGITVRKFGELESSNIRFFDMEGDFAPKLFQIPMCAYTTKSVELKSPALIDHLTTNGMIRWDFEFDNGDMVFLPNEKSMVVGEKYNDGFAPRGLLKGCTYRENGQDICVYTALPNLVLTIPQSKIQGTELAINNQRYRLCDCEYIEFESGDAKGFKAFYVEVKQFQEILNYSLNTVVLDIPGNNFARIYNFAYIKGLSVNFEGAPYVFEERGTVTFSDIGKFKCINDDVKDLYGENGLQFNIIPELQELDVIFENKLMLHFAVPTFMWSKDGVEWHTEPMGEVWHTEFFKIKKLYIKSPARVEVSTDDDEDNEEDLDDKHSVVAIKRANGNLEFDMTRFKTWVKRDKLKYPIKVSVCGKSYILADVYTMSFAASCELSADYEQGQLICHCDIIGMSEYYADIIHVWSNTTIASKIKLNAGEAIIDCNLLNGVYKLVLFETDEDDSGFYDLEYLSFYEYQTTLINKYDYSGQCLRIMKFKANEGVQYYQQISGSVFISQLEKIGKHKYNGMLYISGQSTGTKAHVIFSDNDDDRSFQLFFIEDGYEDDLLDFEFDSKRHMLIRNEYDVEQELSSSERYRRFKMLYNSDYSFYGQLYESMIPLQIESKENSNDYVGLFNAQKAAINPLAMTINELGLTRETYNILQEAGLETVFAITILTEEQLRKKGPFRNRHVDEIKEILNRMGKKFR